MMKDAKPTDDSYERLAVLVTKSMAREIDDCRRDPETQKILSRTEVIRRLIQRGLDAIAAERCGAE